MIEGGWVYVDVGDFIMGLARLLFDAPRIFECWNSGRCSVLALGELFGVWNW